MKNALYISNQANYLKCKSKLLRVYVGQNHSFIACLLIFLISTWHVRESEEESIQLTNSSLSPIPCLPSLLTL